MADPGAPPQGRKRGYSLRTQLFFRNAAMMNTDDLESQKVAEQKEEEQQQQGIEMDPIPLTAENYPDPIPEEDSGSDERVRHTSTGKQYAGRRGNLQKKLTDLKNIILNNKPMKKSKDGRKIPVTVTRNFSREEFPTHISVKTSKEYLIDDRYHRPFVDNTISSSRYSIYSFLPKQLYFQFSKIANLYFMTVSILQMIPSWSTTGTYTTVIPLLIFITISILREGFDDYRRHLQDKKENNEGAKVVIAKEQSNHLVNRTLSNASATHLQQTTTEDSTQESINPEDLEKLNSFTNPDYLKEVGLSINKIKWKDIRVGDIIQLQQDDPVPADILLLTSDGQNENEVFIETMDLDGETNLKSKIPVQKVSNVVNTALGLRGFHASINVEDPNADLYNFEGNIEVGEDIYPLGPDNIIYRGSVVRNTNNLLGLVIFTGEESKIRMNAIKNPRTKSPKIQKAINLIVLFMVFVVLSLSMFSFMGQRLYLKKYEFTAWYLYGQEAGIAPTIMSFIIMYNTLIPLSLYVTTEIIKVVQMLLMTWDIDLYHQPSNTPCEARTATILEELGQVSYIFSDKTGTLTDNLMIFRKFSVNGTAWFHDLTEGESNEADDTYLNDKTSFENEHRHSVDIRRSNAVYTGRPSLASALSAKSLQSARSGKSPLDSSNTKIRTTLDLLTHIQLNPNTLFSKKAKFFFLCLSLCHTCLPKTISDESDEIEYQSSSPDELALVIAARDMGYVVHGKSSKELTIRTYPNGMDEDPVDEKYELLNVVEFSSARKRMSIVVKFPDGRILMICKGADNIILDRLKNKSLIDKKRQEAQQNLMNRRTNEAQIVLQNRLSSELAQPQHSGLASISSARKSFTLRRPSFASAHSYSTINTMNDIITNSNRDQQELDDYVSEARKSLNLQQRQKYNVPSIENYVGNDKLVLNEEYLVERTLQHIDEFSTDGLRTLLYAYKWLDKSVYEKWANDFANAKTSLKDRAKLTENVGGVLESNFELLGATAIEDKLQDGVSDTIEKLRKAGIKLWMLTGDKRETAINIGYSCKLIKDYSTLVILDSHDEDITAKMTAAELELSQGNVAHCVVVIDGATLGDFETDRSLLSIFISLCTKTDSVICCRASPSQKALMVSSIRKIKKDQVTLAIGDGANDIAMIQSADIGIGITGKEGLQAARSSDYSIAQFRFLQKLLLVHGRYNYIRTSKFVLSTFYKELLFYLSQVIYQRNTMFTGTSLYEQWSLSVFNTLFTSLPVLCIGMFEKDLKPATLLAVPELYSKGRLSQAFNLRIFLGWMIIAAGTSLLICFSSWYLWGVSSTVDNTIYPMGVLTYTAIVCTINIKLQIFEQHDRTYLNFGSVLIECLGWLIWCCILPALYSETTSKIYDAWRGFYWSFGQDVTFWATMLILVAMPLLLDFLLHILRSWFMPTDVDEFQVLEKIPEIRRKLEIAAYDQMYQGWDWPNEAGTLKRYIKKKKDQRNGIPPLPDEPPAPLEKKVNVVPQVFNDGIFETEILPSGKVIKTRVEDHGVVKLGKKLRFMKDEPRSLKDDEVDVIIQQRMKDLE